jgi:hypothetical protein
MHRKCIKTSYAVQNGRKVTKQLTRIIAKAFYTNILQALKNEIIRSSTYEDDTDWFSAH